MNAYADIIIDISHERIDRPFTYRVPARLKDALKEGDCVRVPFGKGDTERAGYIIGFKDEAGMPEDRVKDIIGEGNGLSLSTDVTVRLAAWMKETYGSTMYRALKTVAPSRKRVGKLRRRFVSLKLPVREATDLYHECVRKKYIARARLLQALLEDPGTRFHYELLTGKLNVSAAVIKGLAEKGVIKVEYEEYFRNPTSDVAEMSPETGMLKDMKLKLSDEQEAVVNGVIEDFDAGVFKTYLLHGITGSGKTEVYIRLIGEMIRRGRQSIVLIPEIALTFQTLMRFYRHFGDRVSVMHSMLSEGEKADQTERAKSGMIDVIIGPRSALFTPFSHTGLIIIDEEHEGTYKSETMPKYHARETAIKLAELTKDGASVILGSATPSLEAYDRAMKGEYGYFAMTKRLTGGELAECELIDLRDELAEGNRSIFSRRLAELMQDRLEKGEQTMLFINRRGYAGFVSCRACGYVFKCPHCDVSLTAHRNGMLVCHYCGHTERATRTCPDCGSNYVSAFRAGTEQVEKEAAKLFPDARILRMDADTTKAKEDYKKILSAFASKEADLLVGTQMIVKGHDFPDVTLVGILSADMSLHASDYRAAERTFQLLTQAAGRAGRGEKRGSVIIQTYNPDHYSIVSAASQDYASFFEEEISYRRMMMYPPAARLLGIQIFARNEEEGGKFAASCRAVAEKTGGDTLLIGPAPAAIGKLSDVYRIALYAKHTDLQRLINIKDALETHVKRLTDAGILNPARLQIQFDLDPVRGF